MIADGRGVDIARQIGAQSQRFEFRREQETLRKGSVIQRLYAQMVAGNRQDPVAPVPYGKGENAVQAVDAVQPVACKQRQQDLRIRPCAKDRAGLFELQAQLAKIINLAVIGQDIAVVRAVHRLRRGIRQVDNRQAPVAERHAGIRRPQAVTVGAAMGDRRRHRTGQCR